MKCILEAAVTLSNVRNSLSKSNRKLSIRFRLTKKNRFFVTETFTFQSHTTLDRYFFLFSDVVLAVKQKSPVSYKLKEKIKVADMWLKLGNCQGLCADADNDRSMIIGWPTVNYVATFGCVMFAYFAHMNGRQEVGPNASYTSVIAAICVFTISAWLF